MISPLIKAKKLDLEKFKNGGIQATKVDLAKIKKRKLAKKEIGVLSGDVKMNMYRAR